MPSAPTPDRRVDPPGPDHRADPPPLPSPARGPGRRDSLWSAPAAVLVGFTLTILAQFVVGAIAAPFGSRFAHPTPAVNLIDDYMLDVMFVASAAYFAWSSGRLQAASLGYRRFDPRVGGAALLVLGGAYYAVTFLYGLVVHTHATDKLPSELGIQHHTAALVGATVYVCVAAPMAEEFFFRGFLFGNLRAMRVRVGDRDAGPWIAALLTGLLFGAAHTASAPAVFLVPLGFLGFVLCLIRWRTGSLYPCMALHSVNNCIALGVNQEHWSVVAIAALALGSWAVIAAITGPLARGSRPLGAGWREAV